MAKSGPRKTNRYSHEFKATAVRLSDFPDILSRTLPTRWISTLSCCHAGANRHGRG